MKKAEEYLNDSYKWSQVELQKDGVVYWQDLFRKYIRQAQEDAIRETVEECTKNATVIKGNCFEYYKNDFIPDDNKVEYSIETDGDGMPCSVQLYEINKQSILSVADKLIKEL